LLVDSAVEYIDLVPVENDPTLRHVSHGEVLKKYKWLQPWRFQNYTFWDHVLLCPRTEETAAHEYDLGPRTVRRLRADVFYISQAILNTLPPRKTLFKNFYFGSQWWGVSGVAMDLIYEEIFDPDVEEFFRYMEVPDEHFFHCLLGKKLAVLDGMGRRWEGTVMFTDHADPVRARFGDDALADSAFPTAYKRTGKMFARKFDPRRASETARSIAEGNYFEKLEF
jgi:hypothetical protein